MAHGKRGSIQDIGYVMIAILVISILFLVGYKVMGSINIGLQASDQLTDDGKDAANRITNIFPGAVDNSVLIILICLMVGTIALAAMVRIHPIFIVFFVIFLLVLVIVSASFSNIYINIANAEGMTEYAENMPIMTFTISYLPWIVAIFGIILAIFMYKNYSESQYG